MLTIKCLSLAVGAIAAFVIVIGTIYKRKGKKAVFEPIKEEKKEK
jgi:hypothetical protein